MGITRGLEARRNRTGNDINTTGFVGDGVTCVGDGVTCVYML